MSTVASAEVVLVHPVVVVAVPAYNEARFIRETLWSVKAQTFTDFRVVISDNGSTDATAAICAEISDDDPRFTYVRQPGNLGSAGNFQWLLDRTASPYFMWLGAHDLLEPTFLARAVAALDGAHDAALAFSNVRLIDEDGTFLRNKDGGSYHEVTGTPPERYRRILALNGPGELVNNLFRRAALGGAEFSRVRSGDRMVTCHAAYWGPFVKLDAPLYVRRVFHNRAERQQDVMVRVTGSQKAKKSLRATIEVFKEKFDTLEPSRTERLWFRLALYRHYFRLLKRSIRRRQKAWWHRLVSRRRRPR